MPSPAQLMPRLKLGELEKMLPKDQARWALPDTDD